MMWPRTGFITAKHSTAPFGDPGRLTIKVPSQMPLIPRDVIAIGVFFKVAARIASDKPGASLSITARVASGVLSRGLKPVPPVVRIRFAVCRSHISRSSELRASRSSETILVAAISAPSACNSWIRAGPERSIDSPAAQRSLTVITAALIDIGFVTRDRLLVFDYFSFVDQVL